MKNVAPIIVLAMLSAGFCRAGEIHVPTDYTTIQAAVNAAAFGDTVIVADGIYSGKGNRNVRIDKNLTLRSQNGPLRCVLDCQGSPKDIASAFILAGSPKASPVEKRIFIQGFTIRGGYALCGGAIRVEGDVKTSISNCHFRNSSACELESSDKFAQSMDPALSAGFGGAIYCPQDSMIINCTFEGCRAQKGGAVYCGPNTTILGCVMMRNQSNHGGAVYYNVRTAGFQPQQSQLINSILWENDAQYGPQLALGTGATDSGNPSSVPFPPGQQGIITATGRELDLAIDGPDFFILDNNEDMVFTRIGNFALDAEGYLIDSDTNRYVRRWSTAGEEEGYQVPGDLRIRVVQPDVGVPARPTTRIEFGGNLQSCGTDAYRTVTSLRLNCSFSLYENVLDLEQVPVTKLGQFSGVISGQPGFIRVSGTDRAGLPVDTQIQITQQTIVQDVLDALTIAFTGSTSHMDWDGCIRLTDDEPGYSRTWIERFEYFPSESGSDQFRISGGFSHLTVGGQLMRPVAITIFSPAGNPYVLRGTFVKTLRANTWDFVVTEAKDYSGGMLAAILHPRILGLYFNVDGSFGGIHDPAGAWVEINYADAAEQFARIDLVFGKPGEFDRLTQFASAYSSASALSQDGYAAGKLASYSFNNRGELTYTYTNGVKKVAAQIATAAFENPNSLSILDNDCYGANELSGPAQIDQPRGTIVREALELRPAYLEKKPVLFLADRCIIQNGFKAVSFGDPLALSAMQWKTVYELNSVFSRPRQLASENNVIVQDRQLSSSAPLTLQ